MKLMDCDEVRTERRIREEGASDRREVGGRLIAECFVTVNCERRETEKGGTRTEGISGRVMHGGFKCRE